MQSKRIILRRLKPSDFNNMRKLETEADIMKFTPSRIPQTEEQTLTRLNSQIAKESLHEKPFGIWAAELKENHDFVGWFMLIPTDMEFPELGFMIVKNYWRQGFAAEVSRFLCESAFAGNGVHGISARTSVSNIASIRVLEKAGFKYIETVSVQEKNGNGLVDLKIYRLKK